MSNQGRNSSYPLQSSHFRLQFIKGKGGGASGDAKFVGFNSVDGLVIDHEFVRYDDGMSWKRGAVVQFGRVKPLDITLKRAIAPRRSKMVRWIQRRLEPRDLEIQLCDEKGQVKVTWKVFQASPVKISAPTLDASSNEVSIEQISLTASHAEVRFS